MGFTVFFSPLWRSYKWSYFTRLITGDGAQLVAAVAAQFQEPSCYDVLPTPWCAPAKYHWKIESYRFHRYILWPTQKGRHQQNHRWHRINETIVYLPTYIIKISPPQRVGKYTNRPQNHPLLLSLRRHLWISHHLLRVAICFSPQKKS